MSEVLKECLPLATLLLLGTIPIAVRNNWIKLFESFFKILIGIAFMYIILIFFS